MRIDHFKSKPQLEETFTFVVTAGGHAFCDEEWCAADELPQRARMYYVIDGEGEVNTPEGTVYLKPGRLYLLPEGLSHSYICRDHMEKLYFFVTLHNRYGAEVLRGINRVLSMEISQEHIQHLLALHINGDVVESGCLQALLQVDIFQLLTANGIVLKSRRISDTVQKALAYIEENLSAGLTVKTVADHTFISSANLSHKFKAEMGISVSQYIDGMVMDRAEQMLINTELPLSRISTELGFYDQFYFSRRFKEKHAMPPLKYRKSHRSGRST